MTVQTNLKMWVPWYEFAGTERGTPIEFKDILEKYRPSSLLLACARLSVAFDFGPDGGTAADLERAKQWIPILFPAKHIYRALKLVGEGRVLFFQAQLRYLASGAATLNPLPPETLLPIENNELGELLLRAGELLYAPHPRPDDRLDRMADNLARFLPVYEIDAPTDPFLPLIRFYIFLTVNIPRLPAAVKKFDVGSEFEKVFNIPLKTYCEFIFAFLIHAQTERDSWKPNQLIDAGLRVSWFNKTTVPDQLIEHIFDMVCFTLDVLPWTKAPVGYADFEFLKDSPYFKFEDVLYCLDFDYALGKLESNSLWRVMRKLPPSEREPYLSFWGYVFEDYVAWIFECYASKKHNIFHSSPRYQDDPEMQICDAIVVCGSTAVLIEAKLATCPTDVRYSGDYKKMRNYLEKRLVVGSNRPAGVKQLLRAINRIGTGSPSELPPWLRNVRKFVPLIITRDEIGSCWGINSYLDARFEEEIGRKKYRGYTITPLVSMSVSTLERCVRKLKETPFSLILEDRIKSDRELGRPFEAASRYVHRGTAKSMSEHMKIFHVLMEGLIKDFGMVEDIT